MAKLSGSRETIIKELENNIRSLNDEGLELVNKLFGGVFDMERYTTKDEEKLRQYHEYEQAEKLADAENLEKRKAKAQERAAFVSIPLYKRNKTMEMLGEQAIWCLIVRDEDVRRQFDDLSDAYRYEWNFELAQDAFSLGFIWGKRKDRQRRKKIGSKG